MQKGKIANGANPDGTVNDETVYVPESWNDNIGNLFELVENAGYSLIDDDLSQITKATKGLYNPNFTYNTSAIVSQTVSDVVRGSDGKYYEAQNDGFSGDDPVVSVSGNWTEVAFDSGATGLSVSSTAQAQEGTDDTTAISPLKLRDGLNATGLAPIYACRAWVNFDGTGTVAIRASGNVSSITDNGTGRYRGNLITAVPANSAVLDGGASLVGSDCVVKTFLESTTSINIEVDTSSGANIDPAYVAFAVIG